MVKFLFVTDTEASTISTKKGGKKKKKKTVDKNNKQNLDKNGSDLSNKMSEIDQDKMEPLISYNRNEDDKKHKVKGNASRCCMLYQTTWKCKQYWYNNLITFFRKNTTIFYDCGFVAFFIRFNICTGNFNSSIVLERVGIVYKSYRNQHICTFKGISEI